MSSPALSVTTGPVATEYKSCINCDFFIGAHDDAKQADAYGGATPFASCAKKGLFLGPSPSRITDEDEYESYLEDTADRCDSYAVSGRRKTVRRRASGLSFGLQMMGEDKLGEIAPPAPAHHARSCDSCVFKSVLGGVNLGTGASVCLAKAEVLPNSPAAATATAENCPSYSTNVRPPQSDMLENLMGHITVAPGLLKFMEVDDSYGFIIREKIAANRPFQFVEPTTYKTDMAVSDDDKADGIRAWRKIMDPLQKRSVMVPVFDGAFFSEDERKKIPQSGDKEHPELYQDHAGNAYKVATLWFKMDETPCMQGVAGTGKTEFYRYMSWLMQVPFERVSITRSSELDDLAGKMLFENNETVFQKGRIPKAWSKPGVLCLDEPNVGPLDVWQFIRPLTDNSKQLVLDMNNGETIVRHKYCRMGMAINPSWDSRNIGAEPLADADSNRLAHIYVNFPAESIERNIIKNRCKMEGYALPDDQLDKVMAIATTLRQMSLDEDLPITWGIRQQIKVARSTEYFELEDCYKMAATDNLEPEVAETVLNIVRSKSSDTPAWGGPRAGSSRF